MRRFTKMALGALFVFLAVGTLGVSTAIADEELEMVFDVEGLT